jgi:hypothetical protein
MVTTRRFAWSACLILAAATNTPSAQANPADTDPARLARAGCPQIPGRAAAPSVTHRNAGYFVGGGEPRGRGGRCVQDGTWGMDYQLFPNRLPKIGLGWHHGQRYQGGPGAYKTDGHKLLPH